MHADTTRRSRRRLRSNAITTSCLWLLLIGTAQAATTLTIEPNEPDVSSCLAFGAAPGAGSEGADGGAVGFDPTSPYMGFIYQNIPPFELKPGDTLAFDLGAVNDFDVALDIAMAATTVNGGTDQAGTFVNVVSNTQPPTNPRGDTVIGNFEMQFPVDNAFSFAGGGLIIRFSNGSDAYRADDQTCDQVGVVGETIDSSGYFVRAFWNDPDGVTPFDAENPLPLREEIIGGFQVINRDVVSLSSVTTDASAGPVGNTINVGDVIRFTVDAANGTTLPATGVVVTATLDDSLSFVQADATPAAGAVFAAGPPATVQWTIGALGAGDAASLAIELEVPFDANGRQVTNAAAVTAADAPFEVTGATQSAVAVNDAFQNALDAADDGNCFIATAAYGSYLEPEVLVLRQFRDEFLLTNGPGRAFVAWYYRHSPALAAAIESHDGYRLGARVLLSPVVYAIKFPLELILFITLAYLLFVRLNHTRTTR